MRAARVVCLGLGGMLVFFFPRAATFQGFFFLGDFLQQFYPYLTYSFDRILGAGEWPLWTDRMRLGYPLFAEGQAGLLFPTSWAYLVLPAPMAFSVVVLGNVLLGGSGMVVFLKSLGDGDGEEMPTVAALTGAAVYAFSGRFLFSIIGVSDMRVLGVLPWCLWAVRRLLLEASAGRMAACALVLSLLGLAGKPDVAFQALMVILIAAAWWCWERGEESKTQNPKPKTQIPKDPKTERPEIQNPKPKTQIPKGGRIGEEGERRTWNVHHSTTPLLHHSVLLFVLAGLLALGLSAVQWVPTLELLGQSVRSKPVSLERWIAGSLPPKQILGFFVPWLFGNPYEGTYVGGWSFLYLELYLGPVAGVLIVMGLFSKRKDRWLWAGLAALGLLLALGQYLPGYSLLHDVPLLNRGRVPGRWLHLTLVGVSVLASWGISNLKTQATKSEIQKNKKTKSGIQEFENSKEEERRTSNVEMADPGVHYSNAPALQRSYLVSFAVVGGVILVSAFFAFRAPPSLFPRYTHGGTQVFYEEDAKRGKWLEVQRRVGWCRAGLLLGLVAVVLGAGEKSVPFRRWVGPVLLGLLLLDQRVHLSDMNPTQPASVYEAESPVIEFLKEQSPESRFYSHRSHVPAYYLARTRFRRGTAKEVIASFYRHVTPNSALLAGLHDAGGYGELDFAGRSDPELDPEGLKALAVRGVRYVITLKEEIPEQAKVVFESGDAAVFEIRPLPYQSLTNRGKGRWSLLRRESYYPGWAGYVNGKRVPMHRAEGMFQGLEWEEGTMGPWDHGAMGPWDHGTMGLPGREVSSSESPRELPVPKSETQNSEPEIRNPKSETRNPTAQNPDSMAETRNPVPSFEFVFEPLSFRAGLAVSLFALAVLVGLSVFAGARKRSFTDFLD